METIAQLRSQLSLLNERLERIAGGQACTVDYYLSTPLPPKPKTNQVRTEIGPIIDDWWAREKADRVKLAALPAGHLAELRQLSAARNRVIRDLRAADAADERTVRGWDAEPIAWDAPELDEAFGRLCGAIDWGGPGARTYVFAFSQLLDPVTDTIVFRNLDPFTLEALYAGLCHQTSEEECQVLIDELAVRRSGVWDAPVRAGYDFLSEMIEDVIRQHEEARCPNCGDRRCKMWRAGKDTPEWMCPRCCSRTPQNAAAHIDHDDAS